MDFPDDPLWDFSLAVYGREGVPAACLALQEHHGVDVNLMLFALWAGSAGLAPLGPGAMERVMTAVAPLHLDVVRPLRQARRALKTVETGLDPALVATLRKQVARAELDAEHAEQLALSRLAGDLPTAPEGDRAAAAGDNLACYLDIAAPARDGTDAAALETLFRAAFPGVTAEQTALLMQRRHGHDPSVT